MEVLGNAYLEVIQIEEDEVGLEKRLSQNDVFVQRLVNIERATNQVIFLVLHALLDDGVCIEHVLLLVSEELQLDVDSSDLTGIEEIIALEVHVFHVAMNAHRFEGFDHLVDIAGRKHDHRAIETQNRA